MIRVHIICEGQTEESFVSDVLVPHCSQKGIALYPSLIGKPGHKGGNIPDYQKPLMGTIGILGISLPVLRRECQLFDSWLRRLEQLSS
jgi:hypothetical protein